MRETGPDLEDARRLKPRTRTLLSWALWLGAMGSCVAGLVVALLIARPLTADVLLEGALFAFGFPVGYATVGLVLTLRRPANPIGWLYAASALTWSLIIPLGPWIDQLARDQRPLPLIAKLSAMAEVTVWAPAIALGVTLPALLVPDGRLRSRRWRVVERQQLRWVAAGAAIAIVVVSVPLGDLRGPWVDPLAILCVPVTVAVAVLRYRLWDLDRLVSRTVTYAVVTALLIVPYLLVVPAASELAAGSGSLAVAGATLAVAGLFQPVRRRVQDLVDRRFNRRRYDAARTVDGFARRLRDQVDLDALHGELLTVVDQTVQPTRASLWLRPSARQEPLGG